MQLSLDSDEFGRLVCTLSDGQTQAKATASSLPDAAQDLMRAMDSTIDRGFGECYWAEATGDYRLVFRRFDERVQMVVLWSTGTLTGWEHIFRAECELAELAAQVRTEVGRIRVPAA